LILGANFFCYCVGSPLGIQAKLIQNTETTMIKVMRNNRHTHSDRHGKFHLLSNQQNHTKTLMDHSKTAFVEHVGWKGQHRESVTLFPDKMPFQTVSLDQAQPK